MVEPYSKIQRQVTLDTPIVLHEAGEVIRIPGPGSVDIEESLVRQAQQKLRHILPHRHRGGCARRGSHPTIAAEVKASSRLGVSDPCSAGIAVRRSPSLSKVWLPCTRVHVPKSCHDCEGCLEAPFVPKLANAVVVLKYI